MPPRLRVACCAAAAVVLVLASSGAGGGARPTGEPTPWVVARRLGGGHERAEDHSALTLAKAKLKAAQAEARVAQAELEAAKAEEEEEEARRDEAMPAKEERGKVEDDAKEGEEHGMKEGGNATGSEGVQGSEALAREFHFVKLIDPSKLQPFYLLPFSLGLQFALTHMIFGFDIKPQGARSPRKGTFTDWVAKPCASLVFIALALNNIWHDYREWAACGAQGCLQNVLAVPLIMALSPNMKAALALYTVLGTQSPSALLPVTPTYTVLPFSKDFPLFPCATTWLPFLEWVYAWSMFPYAQPVIIMNQFLGCIVGCAKCKITCCSLLVLGSCCWWLFLVIATLGLWAHAKSEYTHRWHLSWGVWYFWFLVLYAHIVMEIFTWLYACTQGIPRDLVGRDLAARTLENDPDAHPQVLQLLRGEVDANALAASGQAEPVPGGALMLRDQEMAALWKTHEDELQKDFELRDDFKHLGVPEVLDTEVAQHARNKVRLLVVDYSLTSMTQVLLLQMGITLTCRLFMANSAEEYLAAINKTMAERTSTAYVASCHQSVDALAAAVYATAPNGREIAAKASDLLLYLWGAI